MEQRELFLDAIRRVAKLCAVAAMTAPKSGGQLFSRRFASRKRHGAFDALSGVPGWSSAGAHRWATAIFSANVARLHWFLVQTLASTSNPRTGAL